MRIRKDLDRNMKKCPECGKLFDVPYPDLWVYKGEVWKKRSHTTGWSHTTGYYCSWTCFRAEERRQEERVAKANEA